jgi:hypothetical protein
MSYIDGYSNEFPNNTNTSCWQAVRFVFALLSLSQAEKFAWRNDRGRSFRFDYGYEI